MHIELTDNYWQEIEALDLKPAVKDALKGCIGAYKNSTVPPRATDAIIFETMDAGIESITMFDLVGFIRTFEITLFRPKDPTRHRAFIYLRAFYLHGENVSLFQ